jgi:hypothetical protein
VARLKKNSIVVQTESGLHRVVVSTALIIPVDQHYPRSVVAPAFDLVINPLVPEHTTHIATNLVQYHRYSPYRSMIWLLRGLRARLREM